MWPELVRKMEISFHSVASRNVSIAGFKLAEGPNNWLLNWSLPPVYEMWDGSRQSDLLLTEVLGFKDGWNEFLIESHVRNLHWESPAGWACAANVNLHFKLQKTPPTHTHTPKHSGQPCGQLNQVNESKKKKKKKCPKFFFLLKIHHNIMMWVAQIAWIWMTWWMNCSVCVLRYVLHVLYFRGGLPVLLR